MKKYFLLSMVLLVMSFSCKEDKPSTPSCDYLEINENDLVLGFSILEKIPGIWNGPVTSSTPLGSYPEWIVDFRPISASNISAKNELDRLNDIFMSFFIVKHDCQNKIAFRNGGGFAGLERISYMLLDSVFENSSLSYYRFSDPIAKGKRVYSDVVFKNDSMIIEVYTNKYNTLTEPVSHMKWKASLRDATSAEDAIALFDFPKKQLEQDFTNTFNGLSEAVFYSMAQDPFPVEDQPHIGNTTVTVNINNPAIVDNTKKVLILVSTEPLFNGFIFNIGNLAFRSRYVFVDAANITDFTFDYMHPGKYYVNAIYDTDGDFLFSSGDYMNSNFDMEVELASKGNAATNVTINFEIP